LDRKNIIIVVCIVWVFLGCKTENDLQAADFMEFTVQNTQVFLSLEDTPFLGHPTSVKAVSEGLLIVDNAYYQITKVDKEGNLLFSFGKQGRGPGEFQSISGYWPLENEILVYDYNSFKFSTFDQAGELKEEEVLDENPVNPNSKYSIPTTLDAISSDSLLIPTGGLQGSLFALVDRSSGELTYAGSAVNEFIKENEQEVMKAYTSGEISDGMLNLVMLSSSSSNIYSFQQTTGVLEKYTHEGEQVWSRGLKIPSQRTLFEKIAEINKGMKENEYNRVYLYARAMDVQKDGVAVLLNVPEDEPLTFAWVTEDGSKIDLVKVEDITLDSAGFMEGFTISPDGQYAYFLKRSKGIIYRFKWPI